MLDALEADVAAVVDLGPELLADGESIERLSRLVAQLDAVQARATAAFDQSGTWRDDGACSPSAWIATTCRVPMPEARRRLKLGRLLRHMPMVEEAWLAGDVCDAHVSKLGSARTPVTEEVFARDEEMLVGFARELRFSHFARAVGYWRQHADPDGVERDADDQRAARRLHLSKTLGDSWVLDGCFDPIGGAILEKQLASVEDELYASDCAEAKARLGRDPLPGELDRTPAQRRADALIEMATRAATAPADGRRPEPLFTVLVGFETFAGRICELANRTPVTPGSLVPWLDNAWVERVVFGGPSRILDVGRRLRLFAGATRRAVQVRDRECFHRFCEEPVDRCQVDHVIPWSCDGPTIQSNGRCACPKHNRNRHQHRPPPPPDTS